MSLLALAWAWEQRQLRPTERLTLLGLANHVDDQGVCFPRIKTLATEAGIVVSSVEKALRVLEDVGLIEREHQYREDGSMRANLYRLRVPPLPRTSTPTSTELAPYPPREMEDGPPSDGAPPLSQMEDPPRQMESSNPVIVTGHYEPVIEPGFARARARRKTEIDEPFVREMIERFGDHLGEEGIRDSISLCLDHARKMGYHDLRAAVRNWLRRDWTPNAQRLDGRNGRGPHHETEAERAHCEEVRRDFARYVDPRDLVEASP